MKKILAIIFLVSYSSIVFTQVLSLEECIKLVNTQNIAVKQAILQNEDAKQQVSIAKANGNPSLTLYAGQNGNFGRSIDRFTNAYISQFYNSSYGGLGLEIPISTWVNNKQNIASFQQNAMSTNENIKAQVMNQCIMVLRSYVNVLTRMEAYEVTKERYKNDSVQVNFINQRVKAGVAQERERLQLQQQLMSSTLSAKVSKQDYTSAMIELCQLINKPFQETLVLSPLDVNDLVELSNDIRVDEIPMIKMLTYTKMANELRTKFIKTQNRPQLAIRSDYGAFYASSNATRNFSEQINDTRNGNISLALNVPLLQNFRTRPAIKQAKINEQLATENINLQKSLLERDLTTCRQNILSLRESHLDAQNLYSSAKANADLLSKMLEVGSANISEYLLTLSSLLNAKSQEINLRYQLIFNQKLLEIYRKG
jgi:outer membrane protein